MGMVDISCYRGKTVVITGAASGMGLCMSRSLCAVGAKVVMCDINAESVGRLADEIGAIACPADVREYADAEKAAALAMERTGRIDLLVPFAGGFEARVLNSYRPFYEQPIEVIDWGVQVNLLGAVYFARACMPHMIRARRGVICCIGSTAGFEGEGDGTMYGVSKSGLFSLVKGLSLAGAEYGVRAFCVSPGPVMTRPGMAAMRSLTGAASPQEVVDFILYLASDAGRCVVGSNHVIDCGRLIVKPD